MDLGSHLYRYRNLLLLESFSLFCLGSKRTPGSKLSARHDDGARGDNLFFIFQPEKKGDGDALVTAIAMVPRLLVYHLLLLSVLPSFCMAFSTPAAVGRVRSLRKGLAFALRASSSANTDDMPCRLRILALHGKGGTGPSFERSLEPLVAALNDELSSHEIFVDCDFPTAPYSLGTDESAGRAWWELPAGERSFTASEYIGYEESASFIEGKLRSGDGYDVVIGHSQGAILLSALFATNRIALLPRRGKTAYIFNGSAIPNPFKDNLFDIQLPSELREKSVALFVVGRDDRINPPDGALQVRDCLEKGGMEVETIFHPGGHSVPAKDKEALNRMAEWIIDTAVKKQTEASSSRL